jgi:hypothetical protein
MKKVLIATLVFSALIATNGNTFAQTETPQTPAAAQSRVVGVVTAVDQAGGKLTIKTDTGESITVITNEKSSVLRLPAGETSAQNAAKIALREISVGERMFAKGMTAQDGKSIDARQVVVTGGSAASADAQVQQRQREDFRQRGLFGRITALDAANKEATIQARSREGMTPVIVTVSDATKVFRYAPDSMNIKDATRSSFSDLKVGDQMRALGERSGDGSRFSAEEVIAGTMTRTGGQVVAVNAPKNEVTIKNAAGQNVTIVVGQRSALRRVTPEMAATFEANRPQRQGAAGQGQSGQTQNGQARPAGNDRSATTGPDGEPRRRERREGAPNAGERPRGGRGFQEMLESLPAITVADLKKGDVVFVSGSEGVDASRVTAIMLVTGDAAFMSRFLQNGPNRGPQSPGLPGDVIGGGVGAAERPVNP